MIDIFSVIPLMIVLLSGDTELGTATGFLWKHESEYYLVSNAHVFSGRHPETNELLYKSTPDRVLVMHNMHRLGSWKTEIYDLYSRSKKPKWAGHPKFGQRVDVAVLKVALPVGTTGYALNEQPFDDISISPAMPVSILGFPLAERAHGFYAIWKTGHIASEPDVNFNRLPVLLVDAVLLPGNSGSPVVVRQFGSFTRSDGATIHKGGRLTRFLGVYSGRTARAELGMVWKPGVIDEILASID